MIETGVRWLHRCDIVVEIIRGSHNIMLIIAVITLVITIVGSVNYFRERALDHFEERMNDKINLINKRIDYLERYMIPQP